MLQDKKQLTLAIVDDHPVVLHGLENLLASNTRVQVVGGFTTGTAILDFLREHVVDVILLDISLPDIHGVELCRLIKQLVPTTQVLAFSSHSERPVVLQMLQSGASGYLLKNVGAEELLTCMEEAAAGLVTFSAEVKKIMAQASPASLKSIPPLTKREKQILQLIAAGKTNNDIAGELSLSILTVETHRKNLMQKFEVKNVVALLKSAGDLGLL